MMRKFIGKHRKLLSICGVLLAAIIITVTTIGVVNNVTAGVYKGDKDQSKEEKGEGNEVTILEIVAEYGQQVLGYTIPGYEPITKDAIEAYPVDGPANLATTEFTNATGWSVNKTSAGYVVNENNKVLNDTFSKNVFGDALNTQSDVKVIVKQANDVTSEDITKCDLIYVNNAKENDSNLMYYYDQVMNYNKESGEFSDKYAKGKIGAYYDTINYESVVASELAVRLIKNSVGKDSALNLEETINSYFTKVGINNTKSIFEVANLDNYKSYNEQAYLNALKASEKGSLSDAVDINTFLTTQNTKIENKSIDEIKNAAGSASFIEDMKDNVKRENFKQTMIKANLVDSSTGLSLFISENFDLYVDKIETTPSGGFSLGRSSINTAVKFINSNESMSARQVIIDNSNKALEEVKEAITAEVFSKSNFDIYRDYNFDAYLDEITKKKITTETKVLEMIEKVNENEQAKAREKIARAAGNASETATLTANDFMAAAFEDFNIDFIEVYKKNLEAQTDVNLFTEEDTKPSYDDDESNHVILHFRADGDYTSATVQGTYTLNGETKTNTIENAELSKEENSNNYYRIVLDLPTDANISELKLTFATDVTSELAEITISDDDASVYGEYWCVFNADKAGNVYESNEEVVASDFGEDYVYGSFIKTVVDDEALEKIISDTNKETAKLDAEVSYDFSSWEVSKALYDYAESNTSGLIFASDIVKNIGGLSYTNSNTIIKDSTSATSAAKNNNLYKALLLIKLRYNNNVAANITDKINDEGVYYPGGIGKGASYNEWAISTFKSGAKLSVYSLYNRTYTYGSLVKFNGAEFNKYNYSLVNSSILSSTEWEKLEEVTDSGATLGDIIRYTMNMYINELQNYPMKILEIEPAANAGELNSYDGAVKLAKWLRIDYSEMTKDNYSKYFDVDSMSVREFNTREMNLTADYDLIYFGVKSGNMRRETFGSNSRTSFIDTSMNGLVYTGIGDEYTVHKFFRGALASDYTLTNYTYDTKDYTLKSIKYSPSKDNAVWAKYFTQAYTDKNSNNYLDLSKGTYALKNSLTTTRISGNDITVNKYNDLMVYVKAGYPILFTDELINSDNYISCDKNNNNSAKWKYLDVKSKLYNFIKDAKLLGYDTAYGEYTGKDSSNNNVFGDGYKYASLVNVDYARYGTDPEKLSAANKFNGGLSFATKRNTKVTFEYVSGPQEYDKDTNGNKISTNTMDGIVGTTIKYGTSEYTRYKVILSVDESVDMEWLEQNYAFQMYIDKSGSGRFTDENRVEIDPDVDFNNKGKQIILEGNWPVGDDGTMDGFVPWRVEAYKKNNADNHYLYTGFSAFEKVDKNGNATKKDVEVLWVATENITMNFENLINSVNVPEYNIKVTKVSYPDFSKKWTSISENTKYDSGNSLLKVGKFDSKASSERKDKEFDMIVFGYCDSYVGQDINNIMCLENIKYFVDAGHSLFFAHDNASYLTTVCDYVNEGSSNIITSGNRTTSSGNEDNMYNFAKYTTSYMRGMLGMDTYGVSYSPQSFIYGYDSNDKVVSEADKDKAVRLNPLYNPAVYNARLYLDQSKLEDFRGYTEGITFWCTNDGNFKAAYKTNGGTGNNIAASSYNESWLATTNIRLTNKGQISVYPYVIGDTLTVGKTHFQYLSLNLEDDNTTVWYVLDSTDQKKLYNATSGDGANGYYIYSNGNITYTGAGHQSDQTTKEKKLFINTVVAAIKAGNYGPEISFTNKDTVNDEESVIYTYDTDKYVNVGFKVSDVDRKKGAENSFSQFDMYFDKIGDADDSSSVSLDANDIAINTANADGASDFIMNSEGTEYINYTKENVLNRTDYTFTLSYVDLANKYNELHDISDRYSLSDDGFYFKNGVQGSYSSEIKDKTEAFFDEYRIAITATDVPKTYDENSTVKGITSTSVARVAFRTLFNLN